MIIMRSVRSDMTSYGGFEWPKEGVVEAPDWNPNPVCGGGLHGLRSGDNDPGEWYDGLILGLEVEDKDIVDIGGKVKFPRCRVVYCGDMVGFCAKYPGCWYRATVSGGDEATVTGGDEATVTGGNWATVTGGDRATVTGGDGATVTGGDGAILSLKWWNGKRYRIAVGYIGEDGLKPNVKYRCEKGKFVEVPK